jgi:hypothetical protein
MESWNPTLARLGFLEGLETKARKDGAPDNRIFRWSETPDAWEHNELCSFRPALELLHGFSY